MKLPATVHQGRPWRVHEVAHGFRLEDVWALPVSGGPDDFGRLVEMFTSGDLERSAPGAVRLLGAARMLLGRLFGWDRPGTGVGARVSSLRERLPADLRDGPRGPAFESLPFSPLYLLDDEWAAETANQTMHGIVHLGWVPDGDGSGRHRGELAVYVRPNGWLGEAYMAGIKPFRYLVVYPALMRMVERAWRRRGEAQPVVRPRRPGQ